MATVLTERQCDNARVFYTAALTLPDEIVRDYARVILNLLETIEHLRIEVRIVRNEVK